MQPTRTARTRARGKAQEARNGLSPTSRTSEPSSYQRLREHLTYLQMTTAAEHLAGELDRALREKLSATKVLEQLLAVEVEAYPGAPPTGALRFARYPVHKTLAEFDLDFQPGIDRKVEAEFFTLRFVEEKRNVYPPGPARGGQDGLWPSRGRVDSWPSRKSPRSSLAAHLRRLVKEHRGQPITLRARVQLRPVRWRTLAPLGQLPAPAP